VPLLWSQAAVELAATAVGRRGGLSPQLADDVAALAAGPGPLPVRVGVLRCGSAPGLFDLLTGQPSGEVPAAGPRPGVRSAPPPDVLPLIHRVAAGPVRLTLAPGAARALERAAAGGGPVRPGVAFAADYRGEAAVRAVTSRLRALTRTPAAASELDDADDGPEGHGGAVGALFVRPPVRYGPGGLGESGGNVLEWVDLPAGRLPWREGRAPWPVRRLLAACHVVVLAFPAEAVLAGPRRPAPGGAGGPGEDGTDGLSAPIAWGRVLGELPNPPLVRYVATLPERPRAGVMADVAGWVGGLLAEAARAGRAGERGRPRTHAVALAEAGAGARVLIAHQAAAGRTTPTGPDDVRLAHARAQWTGSGMSALLADIESTVTTLVDSDGTAVLTRRRLIAAFNDTRLVHRDAQAVAAPDGDAPPAPGTTTPDVVALSAVAAAVRWEALETGAAGALAVRAVRAVRRPPRSRPASARSIPPQDPSDGYPQSGPEE
jgi:hypothetical protein